MQKNVIKAIAFCLAAVLLFVLPAGCKSTAKSDEKTNNSTNEVFYSFEDDLGNKITLKEKPRKVAVLMSSFADVWKTAGGTVDITVGESVERGFAGEDTVLVDDGAGKTINNELLISSKPDLVICSADLDEQIKTSELLNKSGIPCAAFHVERFDEYLNMLKICTNICENPKSYDTYGIKIKEEIDDLLKRVSEKNSVGEKKKILFIRAGSKYSATKAKTAEDNFVCQMLDEMGTYNIAEKAPILLDGLSFEEILSSQPDYIFISTMGNEKAAKTYMNSVLKEDTWQSLQAIKNNNYTYLPKDLFHYKPNAKWAQAYRYLADLLYPEGI